MSCTDDLGTDNEQSTLLNSNLSGDDEEDEHARQVSSWKNLPWWKRPSPYWLIFGTPLGSIGYAALLAPKVALYTTLACRVHKPEYIPNNVASANIFVTTNGSVDVPIPPTSDSVGVTVDPVYIHMPYSAYTTSLDYTQDGDDSEQKCASDPVVQATVARLIAVFATSLGVLACLTTGWWASLSDRYGRRIAFFASVFGLFVTDVTHILTAWFVDVLPGGYWFPLLGSFIEGLCGGAPTAVAMIHTYLADTTNPSTRSRYFSLCLGVLYTGGAVGPVLGGLIIRSTGTLLSAFYFSTVLQCIYGILILLVLPESLTQARARGARLRRSEEKANQVSGNLALDTLRSGTRLFTPLLVLLPERLSDIQSFRRRSWNLFFIAIAYALVTSIQSIASYKFQYAAAQFHWSAETTSYFVSCVSVTRAIFLTVVLPLIIKYLKPAPIQLPSVPDEPLRGAVGLEGSLRHNVSGHLSRSSVFDLVLARTSIVLEATSYLSMAIASTGALFTLGATISSFAGGFSPAAQALALDIYTNRPSKSRGEAGKLYGALSVLQVLMSQIVNPALYGFVYAKTVSAFPQAIMVLSMCTMLLALTLFSFVRISSGSPGDHTVFEERREGYGHVETSGMATPENDREQTMPT